MKQSMREHPLRLFGEKGPESLVMRKYPARFGKGVTKKDHETIMVPRWYPTSFRVLPPCHDPEGGRVWNMNIVTRPQSAHRGPKERRWQPYGICVLATSVNALGLGPDGAYGPETVERRASGPLVLAEAGT